MILQNMNSNEKMSEMTRILDVLNDRVKSYVARNSVNIRKKIKGRPNNSLIINTAFSLGHNGKWDVQILAVRISKDYLNISFKAFQKYFVKFAKEQVSNGIGYYVIWKSFSISLMDYRTGFYDITPHCINRFRQRCPGMEDASAEDIRMHILRDIGDSTNEYDTDVPAKKDPTALDCKYYTAKGQYFSLITKNNKFVCLTTFVCNELLKDEQMAYALALNEFNGTTFTEDDMKKRAIRLIKKSAEDKNNNSTLEEMKQEQFKKRGWSPFSHFFTGEFVSNYMKNKILSGKFDRILNMDTFKK